MKKSILSPPLCGSATKKQAQNPGTSVKWDTRAFYADR